MVLLANAGFFAASGSTFDDEGAWHAINSYVCTSNTASVSMTSAGSEAPWSDYQDLVLIMVGRGTNNGTPTVETTFNTGVDTQSYQWETLHGNGTSVSAVPEASVDHWLAGHIIGADHNADCFCTSMSYMTGINDTGSHTQILTKDGFMSEESSGDNTAEYRYSNWDNSSVVTEFTMNPDGNFLAGSRFDLYGIKGE